jgi:hypothetical protein
LKVIARSARSLSGARAAVETCPMVRDDLFSVHLEDIDADAQTIESFSSSPGVATDSSASGPSLTPSRLRSVTSRAARSRRA